MTPQRRSIFAIAAGPRAKWVVFLIWLVGIFIAFGTNLPGKFSDAEQNESTSFLPGDAESTKVLTKAEELQGGELAPAVIVYRRASGLTAADKQKIVEDVGRMTERRFPAVVADGATGEFKKQYSNSTKGVLQVIKQEKSSMEGKVLWAGVVDVDEDSATVIAATSGTVANQQTNNQPVARNFRLRLDLVRENGRWLTNDLQFVG